MEGEDSSRSTAVIVGAGSEGITTSLVAVAGNEEVIDGSADGDWQAANMSSKFTATKLPRYSFIKSLMVINDTWALGKRENESTPSWGRGNSAGGDLGGARCARGRGSAAWPGSSCWSQGRRRHVCCSIEGGWRVKLAHSPLPGEII